MSYLIRDELFAPSESITIEYAGPNPIKAYKALDGLAKLIFEIKGTNWFEVDYRVDTTTDPRWFFIHNFFEKTFDKFTKAQLHFRLQGVQPTGPGKEGKLTITVTGWIWTEYKAIDNPSLKPIFWPFFYFYHRVFYNQRRRRYMEYMRRRTERLLNELKAMLNIPVKPTG